MSKKDPGWSKDAGFMFGLRKTFPITHEQAWDFMFSDKGLSIWLGKISGQDVEIGKELHLKDGLSGSFTIFKPFSHIRMSWNKQEWQNSSRLQLRIIPSKQKTVISFCHEMLMDQTQRQEMKMYWNQVMKQLTEEINRLDTSK